MKGQGGFSKCFSLTAVQSAAFSPEDVLNCHNKTLLIIFIITI